ncbi:MAG: putative PurR-regulated permease PerM [Lysobacterales bacterium]|jgi:predicted PurR-regulated permease PerM
MNNSVFSNDDGAFQRNMMSSFIQVAALVILVSYSLMIIGPFANTVIWAIILAVAIYPLHLKLAAKIGGRQKWSATIIVLIGLVILLVPGWMITESSVSSTKTLVSEIQDGSFTVSPPNEKVADWPVIGNKVYKAWSAAAVNLDQVLADNKPTLKKGAEWLLHAGGSLVFGLLHFTVSIIIAGVFLLYAKSGYELACIICQRISPQRGEYMTTLSISTVRSVTNGVLGVAVIQAVFAGIGFAVMGVPAAGILTIIILLSAIVQIPAILIMAPIIALMFSIADPVPASIFAIYSILVALSDNVLKPMLLGRGVNLPVLVVLLGAIGGMIKFGVVGLFVGAVILGVGYQLFHDWIWPKEFESDPIESEQQA